MLLLLLLLTPCVVVGDNHRWTAPRQLAEVVVLDLVKKERIIVEKILIAKGGFAFVVVVLGKQREIKGFFVPEESSDDTLLCLLIDCDT
jgi:hypothetical protein